MVAKYRRPISQRPAPGPYKRSFCESISEAEKLLIIYKSFEIIEIESVAALDVLLIVVVVLGLVIIIIVFRLLLAAALFFLIDLLVPACSGLPRWGSGTSVEIRR